MLNIQAEFNITYETKDVISLELKSVFNKFNSYLSNQNVINLLFEKQSIDMKVLKNDTYLNTIKSPFIEIIYNLQNQI